MEWFSSDTHFGHLNIIRLCNRPFKDLDEMHRVLKQNWNEKVAPEDTVYFLGDFCLGQASLSRKILQQLHGKKILIMGNHDKESKIPKECFESICTRMTYTLGDQDLILCHYPYRHTPEEEQDALQKGYKVKFYERRPVDEGGWLIHGHVHEKWKVKRKMINVSVEVWDYSPISVEELKKIITSETEVDPTILDNSNVYIPDGGDNL